MELRQFFQENYCDFRNSPSCLHIPYYLAHNCTRT